jgi:hypothetical protein
MAASRRRLSLRVVEARDGTPGGSDDQPRPEVHLVQGRRFDAIEEAERHLVQRDRNLFQHAGRVVCVGPQRLDLGGGVKVDGLCIVEVTNEQMRLRFNRACDIRKFDRRAEDWISVDCPKDFAQAYREQPGTWLLPQLRAVVTAPTLRPDGSILDRPGYDPRSAIYYDPRGVAFPEIPRAPTLEDAQRAADQIDSLFATLDLVDEIAHSAAMSAVMTPILRSAMTAAPMHGVTAPVAGSGKSKIVNIAAIVAVGHPVPVLALGQREEETEKRLGAALISGSPLIVLDNAERAIGGELLCQAITEPIVAPRILGTSSTAKVANTTSWYATGNNLGFLGDIVRRALLIRIDPRCEQPELREFEAEDPLVTARRERPALVAAVLTIARAFLLDGCPRKEPPLGSFDDWSKWVRDPLIWLGRPDPVLALGEARREDPKLNALVAVMEQWRLVFGDQRVSCRDIAEKAQQQGVSGYSHAELREALLRVGGDGDKISTRKLGQWLGTVKGRMVDGRRLIPADTLHGVARWRLDC